MDPTRVTEIYRQLSSFEITLVRDPGAIGPKYLADQISQCRGYINSVSRIMLDIHEEKQTKARELASLQMAFDIAASDLLANDERVRRQPSIQDRQSTINVLLRDELRTISNLKAEIDDLEFVERAIKHRHSELKATMQEIKLQRSLVRDEIDTGAMYGDTAETSRGHIGPRTLVTKPSDDFDASELDAMFEAATPGEDVSPPAAEAPVVVSPPAAEAAPESPETPPAETTTGSGTTDDTHDIVRFLGEPSASKKDDEDMSEILARV